MPSRCSSGAGLDDDRRAAGSDHRSTTASRKSSHDCKLSRSSLSARTQGAHWASRLSRAVPGMSSPMSPACASSCASGLAMRHSARPVGQHPGIAAVGLRSRIATASAPAANSRESGLPQQHLHRQRLRLQRRGAGPDRGHPHRERAALQRAHPDHPGGRGRRARATRFGGKSAGFRARFNGGCRLLG